MTQMVEACATLVVLDVSHCRVVQDAHVAPLVRAFEGRRKCQLRIAQVGEVSVQTAVSMLRCGMYPPSVMDTRGSTLVHATACMHRYGPSAVTELCMNGFSPNALNNMWDRRRPIDVAVWAGNEECVYALMESGADVQKPVEGGSGPLVLAVRKGMTSVARRLLEAGSLVDAVVPLWSEAGAVTEYGSSLHAAVKSGSLGLCRLLLQFGANILNLTVVRFASMLLLAIENGDPQLRELLLENGGEVCVCVCVCVVVTC